MLHRGCLMLSNVCITNIKKYIFLLVFTNYIRWVENNGKASITGKHYLPVICTKIESISEHETRNYVQETWYVMIISCKWDNYFLVWKINWTIYGRKVENTVYFAIMLENVVERNYLAVCNVYSKFGINRRRNCPKFAWGHVAVIYIRLMLLICTLESLMHFWLSLTKPFCLFSFSLLILGFAWWLQYFMTESLISFSYKAGYDTIYKMRFIKVLYVLEIVEKDIYM